MLNIQTPAYKQTKTRVVGFALRGLIFDFYDLILFSFLLIYIQQEFLLSDNEISFIFLISLAIIAIGGIVFDWLGAFCYSTNNMKKYCSF